MQELAKVTKNPKPRAERGPRIAVDLPVEMHKKSFTLKSHTVALLAEYAAFLSEHHGTKVDEDRVVEGALAELESDRAFARWRDGKGRG